MRAVYCKCKNTYSIECGKNDNKSCNVPDYWIQGIGNINQSDNVYNYTNTSSESVSVHVTQDKGVSNQPTVINTSTTRTNIKN